jgi:serine/threonine protein kinase
VVGTTTWRIIIISDIVTMREKYGYEGQRPFAEEDNLCWFKGYHKGIGVSVLVCEYRLTAHSNDELASKKQEMQILAKTLDRVSRIEHRNIARIYDMIKTDNSLTVILEDCTGGTLIGILKNVKFIDERLALYILKQVSLGLDEMH